MRVANGWENPELGHLRSLAEFVFMILQGDAVGCFREPQVPRDVTHVQKWCEKPITFLA